MCKIAVLGPSMGGPSPEMDLPDRTNVDVDPPGDSRRNEWPDQEYLPVVVTGIISLPCELDVVTRALPVVIYVPSVLSTSVPLSTALPSESS